MASFELELAYRELLLWATETIERALFGDLDPAEHQLRTPKQTVHLPAAVAEDLVGRLAHISVVPRRPAHVWRSPQPGQPDQPDPSDLTANLLGDWDKSVLDSDLLPDDLLDPDSPLDQPTVLERVLDHLEALRDLSERHLPEKSRSKAQTALKRLRDLFLGDLPSDSLDIGAVNTMRRGTWIRDAAQLLRQAAATAGEPLNTDELGHLLADLLDALTPANEPVVDPTSVARLLRKWK